MAIERMHAELELGLVEIKRRMDALGKRELENGSRKDHCRKPPWQRSACRV